MLASWKKAMVCPSWWVAAAVVTLPVRASSFALPTATSNAKSLKFARSDRSADCHDMRLSWLPKRGETIAFRAPPSPKNGTEPLGASCVEGFLVHETSLIDDPLPRLLEPLGEANGQRVLFTPEPTRHVLRQRIGHLRITTNDSWPPRENFGESAASIESSENSEDESSQEVWTARLLLLLSAALYGTNFTIVKTLDESLSVGVCSTLRFGFAALSMLPWLFAPISEELRASKPLYDKEYEEPSRLTAGLAGMEIGLWNSVGYIAQALSLKATTASKSAFICSMAVVTVPVLDFIVGKQLLRREIVGACLAAIGVWSLEIGGHEDIGGLTSGDIASLVQPLMFGLGFWRMESAMAKYHTEAGRLAAGQLLMVFLVSLSYLIGWSSKDDNSMLSPSEVLAWLQDPIILGMLIWTGIITTALTIWMETEALKTLSASETTLIFTTEPLFGAAFAAVVAHECLGIDAAIGAAFIIGGCLVSGIDLSRYSNLFRCNPTQQNQHSQT